MEPLNCTTIIVRWQLAPRNSVSVQGYRLFYHEESQSESAPVQLRASDNKRTIGGLGKFRFRSFELPPATVEPSQKDIIQCFHGFLLKGQHSTATHDKSFMHLAKEKYTFLQLVSALRYKFLSVLPVVM